MISKLLSSTRALLIGLATLCACEGDSRESETFQHEAAGLPDGIRHAVVDGVDSWEITGIEAHEWFHDRLVERVRDEDPARARLTWELIEIIENGLDDLESDNDDADDQRFRAKTASVSLNPLIIGSERGWNAVATASKSGLPATLEVETTAQAGNTLAENNDSKWGTGTLNENSNAKEVSPSTCYARAYARAGSTSAVQETFVCP